MWYETISNRKKPLKKPLFMRDIRLRHGAFRSSRILVQRRFCCCLPKFREVLSGPIQFGTDKLYQKCRKRTTNTRCITFQKNKGLILLHCHECSTPLTMAPDGERKGQNLSCEDCS